MEGEVRDKRVGEPGTPRGRRASRPAPPDAVGRAELALARRQREAAGGSGRPSLCPPLPAAGGGTSSSSSRRPPPAAPQGLVRAGSRAQAGRGAQELAAGFSLLGELEEEEDDDEEKLTPVRPGGLVAVF